jgi:cell division protein FtsB
MTTDDQTPHDEPMEVAETTRRPRVRRRPQTALEVRERRRRWMRYTLAIVSGVLMINALVGEKGYLATLQARQQRIEIEASVNALQAENEALVDLADRLRRDPLTLEAVAREDLGLIKPGETLVTLKDRPKSN